MRYGSIGLTTAVVLASAMVAAGCSTTSGGGGTGGTTGGGTGGSGAGGAGVTGISGTKAINALTPAEGTQLCNDTYSYFGGAIPHATACKWKGLSRAASSSAPTQDLLRQNCTTAESGCLQSDAGAFSNPGCGDLPTNCTATVAQYAACISDEVAAFNQTVNGFPACTALTSAGTAAIFDAQAGGTPPASCTSLGDACPALSVPNPLTSN